MASNYDVVVIGSGPGGYVAAIRCAQLKMSVALVEKYPTLGGTCLNVGCIPSKALLDSSEKYYELTHSLKNHGINSQGVSIDFKAMIERKNKVVSQTCDGIQYLMKKNKIDVFTGVGSFKDSHTLTVHKQGASAQDIVFKNAIIATGSKPSSLANINIDKKRIITSTEALSLEKIPEHLIVIGGGVIGLELGSVYQRLGSKVSVVEFFDRVIPTMDSQLGVELKKILTKQGVEFYLSHKVESAVNMGEYCIVKALDVNSKTLELKGDLVLMSVGRKAYTEGLGLETIGIKLHERGYIETNDHLQTSVEHIYAIGDCVKGPMLAHKGEEEGVYVAEYMNGQKPHINYNLIPGVVYTWPEVASVGASEDELKKNNIPYKKGLFPFKALGRARASEDTDGFVKILANPITDEILGVNMIGARAADMIASVVTAMEYKASCEDIARICHAHPTFSEAIKEAALDATDKRAIHL